MADMFNLKLEGAEEALKKMEKAGVRIEANSSQQRKQGRR